MGQALARQGRRARWCAESDELVWVFELDRGRAWSPWTMMVGGAVRERLEVEGIPTVADCHAQIEYALMPSGIPDAAIGTRFNDHRSFFTMVFDHKHDLVPDDVRREAFAYMAADLQELPVRLATLHALREAVTGGTFSSGFVDRRLP